MLDVRPLSYVSPLAEVPFTDVALVVRITNQGDETASVTGLFRIYNTTTGELVHHSEIAPITLAPETTADVSALTSFPPPAPLDDTYMVAFQGHARNPLVPSDLDFFLGTFTFDVKPGPLGEPPAAHAPTHEQAGSDPIETADLGTSELDTALRLAPDGAGGVKWNSAYSAIPLLRLTTAEMNALPTTEGSVIFNTDWHAVAVYDGTQWAQLAFAMP